MTKEKSVKETIVNQQKEKKDGISILEVDTDIIKCIDRPLLLFELDSEDVWASIKTYRSENACRKAISRIIHKYYNIQKSYISPEGYKFVGKIISKHYVDELTPIVENIIDFMNMNYIKVDMTLFYNFINTMGDAILAELKSDVKFNSSVYSVTDWKDYSGMIGVRKVDDVICFLGDMRDVERYELGSSVLSEKKKKLEITDITKVVEEMDKELERIFDGLDETAHSFVLNKYIYRISNFIRLINLKIENDANEIEESHEQLEETSKNGERL